MMTLALSVMTLEHRNGFNIEQCRRSILASTRQRGSEYKENKLAVRPNQT